MSKAVYRIDVDGEVRLAVGDPGGGPRDLVASRLSLDEVLGAENPTRLSDLAGARVEGPVPDGAVTLPPAAGQEIWAAGVTYLRSRVARGEEARTSDPYDLVYEANRPELFLKSAPGRARGPGEPIGIRADSGWDVPEPELTVVLDAAGVIVGYTIGNDVSSRAIEGENPLYLPQAKTYTGSCAVGPCIVPADQVRDPMDLSIHLQIKRSGRTIFDDKTSTSQMHRHVSELSEWLFAANEFPAGVLLMTGTGLVPEHDVTLAQGDLVEISIDGLGCLSNQVEVVGATSKAKNRC